MPMILLSNHIILISGWRNAYRALSYPLLLAIPVILLTVRSRPQEMRAAAAANAVLLPGLEIREALGSRSFWLIAFAQFSFWFVVAGSVLHAVPYLVGLGYAPTQAALVLTFIYGLGTTGKFLLPAMADRFGAGRTLTIDFFALGIGQLLFLGARSPVMIALYLLLFGLTCGAPMALLPMIQAECLGLKRFGTLNGLFSIAYTAGVATGPLVAGKVFDATRNYTNAFVLFSAVAIVAAAAARGCPPLKISAAEPHGTPAMASV
jgi:MFS family permease